MGSGAVKKTYEDGSFYEGDVDERGREHGKGRVTLTNGNKIEGSFNHGVLVQSRIRYSDDSCYEGQLLQNKWHGKGVYTKGDFSQEGLFRGGAFVHGCVKNSSEEYVGSVFNGLYEGEGTLRKKDGTIYHGEFKKNKFYGFGMLKVDKVAYKGDFKDGLFEGQGLLLEPNFKYDGEFLNGKKSGKGKIDYQNGDVYQGEFRDGVKHGQGMYKDKMGNIYNGCFFEDTRCDSECKIEFKDGSFYEGGIQRDLFNGFGKLTAPDESVYEGEFKDGLREGLGVFAARGVKYEGYFKEGKKHGIGKHTETDSSGITVYQGEFVNDLRHGKVVTKKMNALGEEESLCEINYVNDVKEGEYFKKKGKSYEEKGSYFNGVVHGIVEYIKNGEKFRETFDNGRFIPDLTISS